MPSKRLKSRSRVVDRPDAVLAHQRGEVAVGQAVDYPDALVGIGSSMRSSCSRQPAVGRRQEYAGEGGERCGREDVAVR